jgi:branched-subunit amino acid ABC-type transport system permease component
MKRFDWIISRRNFREYAVSAMMLILFVSNFFHGDDRFLQVMAFAMTCFYVGYIWWWSHERLPLDPSADARTYQAAMLTRLDRQIHLLGRLRWFGIPLALLNAWVLYGFDWPMLIRTLDRTRLAVTIATIIAALAVEVVVFAGIVWVNERSRWGIPLLQAARANIERLYGEE